MFPRGMHLRRVYGGIPWRESLKKEGNDPQETGNAAPRSGEEFLFGRGPLKLCLLCASFHEALERESWSRELPS